MKKKNKKMEKKNKTAVSMKNTLIAIFLFASIGSFAQKPVFTSARMKSATVYFRSAELTQTASVLLAKGTNEIVVRNVADRLNENTLKISMPPHATVLSAQYTHDYLSEYGASAETKKVRDSIATVEKSILSLQTERETLRKSVELLDKNQQVFGENSGLNVDELAKMLDFYRRKRTELNTEVHLLDKKEEKLNETLAGLKSRLEVGSEKGEKISKGKLVLHVMSETAGNADFDISYLTTGAMWAPLYDLRAENLTDPIRLMYKAQIGQHTGIDWKGIKLTLSSGNPNQNNQAPTLDPWFLGYDDGLIFTAYESSADGAAMRTSAKRAAAPAPLMESSISNYAKLVENQLNVSFDIDLPYDILSNGKPHSVSLKEIKIPAGYKYYTVPRMESEAYLLAEVDHYAQYNLLPGEANIVFEGMYVGRTFIHPNQTADTLQLSLGRDKRVSVKREKITDRSSTKFLSNAKQQAFTYEITVRNNKKDAVNLIVKDQYPLSTDKEIEVELQESSGAEIDKETGILTWTANLKPNETRKFRIGYRVKYPKGKTLGNVH